MEWDFVPVGCPSWSPTTSIQPPRSDK